MMLYSEQLWGYKTNCKVTTDAFFKNEWGCILNNILGIQKKGKITIKGFFRMNDAALLNHDYDKNNGQSNRYMHWSIDYVISARHAVLCWRLYQSCTELYRF